jgi:hypothetical protein
MPFLVPITLLKSSANPTAPYVCAGSCVVWVFVLVELLLVPGLVPALLFEFVPELELLAGGDGVGAGAGAGVGLFCQKGWQPESIKMDKLKNKKSERIFFNYFTSFLFLFNVMKEI